jgi:translocation and assembly module TamA
LASLLLAAPAVEAAKVRLQLEGLTGDLQKNVRARLSTIGSDEVSNDVSRLVSQWRLKKACAR